MGVRIQAPILARQLALLGIADNPNWWKPQNHKPLKFFFEEALKFWGWQIETTSAPRQACSESEDIEKRFERCKELALGVDLEDFAEQDTNPTLTMEKSLKYVSLVVVRFRCQF